MLLFQDPTSLHRLVVMGALYETLRCGRKESFLLGSLVSKLYNVIGEHIKGNGDLNTTMNAMATLALIAVSFHLTSSRYLPLFLFSITYTFPEKGY